MEITAHRYALEVISLYASGKDNALEVYQQFYPWDKDEESDIEYVYRVAAELDFPEGVDNLVYLDVYKTLSRQTKH